MRIRGGSGAAQTALLFLWQIVWPCLFYEAAVQLSGLFFGTFLGPVGIMIPAAGVTAAVLFYFYGNRKERYRSHAGRSFKVRLGMPEAAALILVLAVSSNVLFNIAVELSGIVRFSASYGQTEEILYGTSLFVQILFMVCLAPVAEELIFRGMCYERLRNIMGIAPAAVLSAGLFGLFHGNLVQGIYGFALGILAAVVYEHFDGLLYSILFHGSANLFSILLTLLSGAFPAFFNPLPVKLALFVLSAAVLAFSLRKLYSRRRRMTK